MLKNYLDVELLTENGNVITEFQQGGRTYVEGRKGSKYKIKIKNNRYGRIKVITSVDGLDVLTGKRATPNSGGYVIDPVGTLVIDGWRISDSQVREFFFTKQNNSYNAKTGNDTNNLGVIGVMAYAEYFPPVTYNAMLIGYNNFDSGRKYFTGTPYAGGMAVGSLMNMTTDSAPLKSTTSSLAPKAETARSATVGTGMGEKKESHVTTINATWNSTPMSVIEIYYKSRKELEAMGIVVAQPTQRPLPSAFAGYCKEV